MKILFIHSGMPTFAKKDFDILSEVHDVRALDFPGPRHGWGQVVKQLPALCRSVQWADLTFSWFGKLHAFFAVSFGKILAKKSVIVAGGDDVANVPEIKYGMFAYWWKRCCPLFVFRYTDLSLCVSEHNLYETIENAKANPNKVTLTYHGFDPEKFRLIDCTVKEQLVITVGGVDWERLERKGYERFVRSAAYLPEVQFALIGQWYDDAIDYLRDIGSDNVAFTGRVSDEELLKWFSRAKVYVQASVHEGFGCSVAEAMLCECVPVVSRHAALPEVVGDCGFYVDELVSEVVSIQVERALASDLGELARERIVRKFPLEKRKSELLQAITELQKR